MSGRELRRREEEVAEWSAALLGVLQATPSTPKGVALESSPSTAWRYPAGGLTPVDSPANRAPKAQSVHEAGADDAPDGEPNQVHLELSVGRLGTIALTVERGPDGVRLLLGAVEQATARLLESERQAIEQALALGGLRVESIKFVTMSSDGPEVAYARLATSKRLAKKAASEFERGSSEKRKPKRLNVLG